MKEGKRDTGKERKLKHLEGRDGDDDGERNNAKVMSRVASGDGNLCLQVSIARLSETHRGPPVLSRSTPSALTGEAGSASFFLSFTPGLGRQQLALSHPPPAWKKTPIFSPCSANSSPPQNTLPCYPITTTLSRTLYIFFVQFIPCILSQASSYTHAEDTISVKQHATQERKPPTGSQKFHRRGG